MKTLVMRIINLGTAEFDQNIARRVRIINIVALVSAITQLGIIVIVLSFQNDWGWKLSAERSILILILILPVFIAHKFGYRAKLGYFIFWFFIFIAKEISYGQQNGTHFYLLATPVVLFYFLGSAYSRFIAILTILVTGVFLTIFFAIPDSIGWGYSVYDAMKIPFVDDFNLTGNDYLLISNIFSLELVLFLTTYVAFSAIERSEAALENEYARSELLLQNLLPKSIAIRLKDSPDDVIADQFDDISILFADIEGFTKRSSEQSAEKIVGLLNQVFSEFDKLADKHGLEKIKTIGDAYMVAGGLPEKRAGHASALAEMALDMIVAVENLSEMIDEEISVRIGLHSGPAVAGVIGRQKPFYDVWGDTINIASRMESSSSAGRIQITPKLKDILGDKFEFEERGIVEIKGKGEMNPYYLVGRSK